MSDTSPEATADDRQTIRERLADRLGFLLAKSWLRSHDSPGFQSPPTHRQTTDDAMPASHISALSGSPHQRGGIY
jgi:hypothetical protein